MPPQQRIGRSREDGAAHSRRGRSRRRGTFALLAVLAGPLLGCGGASAAIPVSANPDVLVGQFLQLPKQESRVEATACRVVVVSTTDCGVAAALARGWNEDVRAAADSVGVSVLTQWIVFGPQAELTDLMRLATVDPPRVVRVDGGDREMMQLLGVRGSPHTLILGPGDTVRGTTSGNAVPTAGQLRAGCLARGAVRPGSEAAQ